MGEHCKALNSVSFSNIDRPRKVAQSFTAKQGECIDSFVSVCSLDLFAVLRVLAFSER